MPSALTRSLSQPYDKAARRTKIVDGEGINIVYSCDDANRLVSVTERGNTRGAFYYGGRENG